MRVLVNARLRTRSILPVLASKVCIRNPDAGDAEPDLAYILVETLICKIERVALAFRAWTLLKPPRKPVRKTKTRAFLGNPRKNP
jgi:hypothetical protein